MPREGTETAFYNHGEIILKKMHLMPREGTETSWSNFIWYDAQNASYAP